MNWQSSDVNNPSYYWENFNRVIDWVTQHHSMLLGSQLQRALNDYEQLSANAQKLWVRLFSRKGEFFRVDKLRYAEIDIADAIIELHSKHWITSAPLAEKPLWLPLITKAELAAELTQNSSKYTKAELIDLALEHLQSVPIEIIQLLKNGAFQQLSILFFGNAHQQLTELVTTELGHVRYEQYVIRPKGVFSSIEDFEQFWSLQQWQDRYRQLESQEDKYAFAQVFLDTLRTHNYGAQFEGKKSRLINKIARDCERLEHNKLALTLYKQSNKTPARERSARIYKKANSAEKAQSIIHEMLKNPYNEPEYEVAQQLNNRWFTPNQATRRFTPETQILHLDFQSRQVERAVLEHFQADGWQGDHSENLIPQSLFGLIFWDIIFADVPGAFIHPFQRGPRDLNSSQFLPRRKAQFIARIQQLENSVEAIQQQISDVREHKRGIANPFIHWGWNGLDDIEQWLTRLPIKVWSELFMRMGFDVSNNRSGFPDLWLYQPKRQKVQLIEVKAPGDSLRANQIRWLRFFQSHHVTVTVINARPSDDGSQ